MRIGDDPKAQTIEHLSEISLLILSVLQVNDLRQTREPSLVADLASPSPINNIEFSKRDARFESFWGSCSILQSRQGWFASSSNAA